MGQEGQNRPVIGREKEISRVIQILSRRTKNNPVLIGAPGVGKTAIAEGLAQRIINGNVPDSLLDKRIFSLDLASIVAGTKYRGEFEERIKRILDVIEQDDSIILFIDEIHQLIGAGASKGPWMQPISSNRPWPGATCSASALRPSTNTRNT